MERMPKIFWSGILMLFLIVAVSYPDVSAPARTAAEMLESPGADQGPSFQNEPPQLTCPSDDSVHTTDTFKSTAFSVTDPDGDATSVEFLDIDPPAPINPRIVRAHVEWWTATAGTGDYTIRLVATDSNGLKDTCEFTVAVWNRPAEITCPRDDSVQAGQTFVSEDASVFDPDGDPVAIRLLRIDPKPTHWPTIVDKHVEWVTTQDEEGEYVITLLAGEFCGPTDTCEFTVTVLPDGGPGDLTCPEDDSVHATVPPVTFVSTDFSITGPGTDPSDVTLFRVEPAPFYTPFIVGSHVEWLTHCDDAGKDTFRIWLEAPVGGEVHDTCSFKVTVYNRPPELTCPEDGIVYSGHTFVSTGFTVTDPDGDSAPVTFLDITPSATNQPTVVGNHVEWITTSNEADREFHTRLVATDPCGLADTCQFMVTVLGEPTNTLTCPEDDSVHATDPPLTFVSTNFSVTGPGADPSRVQVISIDPSPAVGMPYRVESHIEWPTHCDDADKVFTICLEATFDIEPKLTCCFNVTVYNRPPQLTCPDYGHVAPNRTFVSTDFSVFDPDGDPVVVTLLSIEPAPTYAPSIVENHVEWRTRCSDAGKDYVMTLRGTDPCGLADTCQFTVTVSYEPAPDFYIWVYPVTQQVAAGEAAGYLVQLYSLYGFGQPCSLFVSGLPDPPNSGFFDEQVLVPTSHTMLHVQTTAETPSGAHTLSVTAKEISGPATHTVKLYLDVAVPPPGSGLAHSSGEEGISVRDKDSNPAAPEGLTLFQNQPNPFNPETRVNYYLPTPCQVKLTVYNLVGQRVKTLFHGYQGAGLHTVTWDGKNDDHLRLSSGIYFCRLEADQFYQTRKMTLMK